MADPITVSPSVATALIVAGGAFLGGVLGNLLPAWVTRGTKREELEATKIAIRQAFQRETLRDLQEALSKVVQAEGYVFVERLHAFGQSGEWKTDVDDVLEAHLEDFRFQTDLLKVRVLDDRVRELVDLFEAQSTRVGTANLHHSKPEASAAITQLIEAAERANERIGQVLRSLY